MPGFGSRYVAITAGEPVRPTLANLKSDSLLFTHVIGSLFRPPANEIPEIAAAEIDALDHWNTTTTSEKDDITSPAIDGAFNAIYHFVAAHPDAAYTTCRHVGTYFRSKNINVAFTAIRHFEFPGFSRYTIFVSDLLLAIATSNDVIKSPVEMTLRGIAFRALFGLDPQYKHWPQLQRSRDECVHGLLTWGGSNDRNRLIAAQIMRYVHSAT